MNSGLTTPIKKGEALISKTKAPFGGVATLYNLILIVIFMIQGCGIAQMSPYYPDKSYGRTKRTTVGGGEIQGAPEGSGDAQKNDNRPPPPGSGDADKKEPSHPPAGNPPEQQNPPSDQRPPIPAPPTSPDMPPSENTIVQKWEFRVAYDLFSAKGLRNNSPSPIVLSGPVADQVRSRLNPGPEDGLILSQSFGDGSGRFQTFYALKNSVADHNRLPASPSISSVKTFFGAASTVCNSNAFTCADRLVLAPLRGQMETVCFLDPATGMPMGYPITPHPTIKSEDLIASVGVVGPFHVRIFQGDVPCKSNEEGSNRGPYVTETVSAKISVASLDGFKYLLQSKDPIMPTVGVTIENIRASGNLVAPYLDETARINGKTTFFINGNEKQLVKMIVQSRLSLDVARALGGGIFAGFIDELVNLDGILVDLHYEFCRNLLDPKATDHCPIQSPS